MVPRQARQPGLVPEQQGHPRSKPLRAQFRKASRFRQRGPCVIGHTCKAAWGFVWGLSGPWVQGLSGLSGLSGPWVFPRQGQACTFLVFQMLTTWMGRRKVSAEARDACPWLGSRKVKQAKCGMTVFTRLGIFSHRFCDIGFVEPSGEIWKSPLSCPSFPTSLDACSGLFAWYVGKHTINVWHLSTSTRGELGKDKLCWKLVPSHASFTTTTMNCKLELTAMVTHTHTVTC